MRLVRQGMAFGEEVQVLYGAKIRYLLVRLFKRCPIAKIRHCEFAMAARRALRGLASRGRARVNMQSCGH